MKRRRLPPEMASRWISIRRALSLRPDPIRWNFSFSALPKTWPPRLFCGTPDLHRLRAAVAPQLPRIEDEKPPVSLCWSIVVLTRLSELHDRVQEEDKETGKC